MDNIAFGKAFYSFREPAWHALGTVSDTPRGAVEAFSLTAPYDLELKQLSTADGLHVPLRGIFRTPLPEDPEYRFFGSVGMEYELVTPQTICEIYDRAVNKPVETLGALGKGEQFFLTTKMPRSSFIGSESDQVDHYLLVDAPMAGNEALTVRNVDIRVVCQNTLLIARRHSVQTYRIRHEKGAAERLEQWMQGIFSQAEENIALIENFFGAMTKSSPDEEQVGTVLKAAYPNPKPPQRDAPPEVMKTREERFEWNLELQVKNRTLAQQLFEGAGTGMDLPGASGTFWGLYNAVVELEDYRGNARTAPTRQKDTLFGYRASVKEEAFSAILAEIS